MYHRLPGPSMSSFYLSLVPDNSGIQVRANDDDVDDDDDDDNNNPLFNDTHPLWVIGHKPGGNTGS